MDITKCSTIELLLSNDEFTSFFLQELLKDRKKAYKQIAMFNEAQQEEYQKLLNEFERLNGCEDESVTTKQIGDSLENLVNFIFDSLLVFDVIGKVPGNSNEYDQIVSLSNDGAVFKAEDLINIRQNYFISECKNFDDNIGVTWVNKFYSLLDASNTLLGIIFSYHGLSGKKQCGGWKFAKGFTKKALLKSMGRGIDKEIYIIDFNKEHFKLLGQGKSFLEILDKEKELMKLDVNSDFIMKAHKNTEIIKDIIEKTKEG